MFLQTRDGVRCDICGTSHRKKFTYYSMDCGSISVNSSKQLVGATADKSSHDVCEACYEKMLDKCRANIGDVQKDKIKCDQCPTYMAGTFIFIRSIFTKVEVDSEQQPEGPINVIKNCMDLNFCDKCKSEMFEKIDKIKSEVKEKGEWS